MATTEWLYSSVRADTTLATGFDDLDRMGQRGWEAYAVLERGDGRILVMLKMPKQ